MSQVVSGFAPINSAELYYEIAGEGQPLVFIHAGVADHRLWDDQFQHFADRYRVMRFDMRGFGRSEMVDGDYSRREDLIALLEHLGLEDAILVGCSMGGMLAMDVAFERPALVRALVMVCSGPNGLDIDESSIPDDPELTALFKAAEAAWKEKDIERVAELETQIWFDGRGRTPADVDPARRAKALEMNRIVLMQEAKGLGTPKKLPPTGAGTRLHELAIPVLVIVGAHDEPFSFVAADVMIERIPNATKVLLDDTAHLPSLERPAEFNAALDNFLTTLYGQTD